HHQHHGNGPKAVNIRPIFGWCGRQDQPIHDCATNGISEPKFTGLASRNRLASEDAELLPSPL
ncbi:MAG TPA: hypothetical protein VNN81_14875, partial [Bradyrhizobium sp.]|nr:hypothetical protein [Bradyrhizobium sp.]